ncbi:MAG: hypothetical protein H0X64_11035, partial [Gemmatimonadaceae bacterium]|nr:hypothetical protein [Gemmatimonadaceae bacterium]
MRLLTITRTLALSLSVAGAVALVAPQAAAQAPARDTTRDPRIGLRAGWNDAGSAISNLQLLAHRTRPAGFVNPQDMGDFGVANSDIAFRGNLAFQGNFNGFQVWDISTPANPRLRTSFVCPGGQGDLSVHGNLLFMSVEETRGRLDCGTQGVRDSVSRDRFRGVRIFDISNLDAPRQVAAVQSCRGSHTHTLVTDPKDRENVYVYIAGTAGARSPNELAGCIAAGPEDTTSAYFRIEVVRVPLAAPQNARIVSMPRIFADSTGNIAGLWAGGPHGPGTQTSSQTNQCHDITAYPEIGLAAGACSGNGILLDISDVVNPRRIDEVVDPNFAYWHSATFNNDGSTVIFTDEWGGGTAPRCRATDRPEWGANALFTLTNRRLQHTGYFKLPAPQTATENCVAHNGSLIPVPGRDIMVQAWYQGGISVFDFTNPAAPVEIAYFDRGPLSATQLALGGYWAAYWYNGHIYGSEIARGFDVFSLQPSEHLSADEIAAARLARVDMANPQLQTRSTWPSTFVVARAYIDGLAREDALRAAWATSVRATLALAERQTGAARRATLMSLSTALEKDAASGPAAARVRALY